MITGSNSQQSTYHQDPPLPLFAVHSNAYHNTASQQHIHRYYQSPSSSPATSPTSSVLTHCPLPSPSYYPQSTIMDPYNTNVTASLPISCLSVKSSSIIRFDILLEAPTAASQKSDESPLTYLNKGQYYNISLKDREGYDGEISSTFSITFHDEGHRQSATDYWKFWLTQQKESNNAKAVELDLTKSNGAQLIECRHFNRVSFKWNGKLGASVHIRFNCLSTDFSRIKGVKGIPLRLQVETEFATGRSEKTYCQIKLFRDKGAERKNKDDAKHIERQLEKLRGKNGEPHPLWLAFSPTSPVTPFAEVVPPNEDESDLYDDNTNRHTSIQKQPEGANTNLVSTHSSKRGHSNNTHSVPLDSSLNFNRHPFLTDPRDIDMDYKPTRKRRLAKLSIFVKSSPNSVYRAVYLMEPTVKELTTKITERMEINQPIADVYRKVKNNKNKDIPPLVVTVDDEVVRQMTEEQPIYIETEQSPTDSNKVNLVLNF